MDTFFSSVVHVCVCMYYLCMYARMDGWTDEWMYVYNYECIHTCVCVCAHTYNYESMHTHVCTYMHEFPWNSIVV